VLAAGTVGIFPAEATALYATDLDVVGNAGRRRKQSLPRSDLPTGKSHGREKFLPAREFTRVKSARRAGGDVRAVGIMDPKWTPSYRSWTISTSGAVN